MHYLLILTLMINQSFQLYEKLRTINIRKLQVKIHNFDDDKTQYLYQQDTPVHGVLFINLVDRTWDFTLDENMDAQLQKELSNMLDEEVGIKYLLLGGFEKKDDNLMLILKSPHEIDTQFETSMLANNCWRVDIFPKRFKNVKATIKFCSPSLKKSETIRKYTYILDNHVLGDKNNE